MTKLTTTQAIEQFTVWANNFSSIDIEDKSTWNRMADFQKYYGIK